MEFGDDGALAVIDLFRDEMCQIHTYIFSGTNVSPLIARQLLTQATKSQKIIELRWGNQKNIENVQTIPCQFNQVIVFEHQKIAYEKTPLPFSSVHKELLMDICKFQIPIIFGMKPVIKDYMADVVKLSKGQNSSQNPEDESQTPENDLTNETIRKNIEQQ